MKPSARIFAGGFHEVFEIGTSFAFNQVGLPEPVSNLA